jgi:Porin PorA
MVGRRIGFVLAFLGLFLLFFGVFERFYAYPRLKKAPLDQYSQPVATGTGTYFNRSPDKLREIPGAQLQNVRTVRGDVKAGSDEVAVWDSFNSTVDVADGGVITATQERIALDRVTAQSVQCCGENPRHQGLTLKFPFDTKKQSYQFWDGPSNRATDARFIGEEQIEDVKVYRFEQRIGPLTLGTREVPGSLAGDPDADSVMTDIVYSNVKTIWVEPTTGIIVKAQQDVAQVLETPDGNQVLTLLDGVLTYNDATVKANADDAADGAGQLRLLGMILPLGAALAGLVLLVVGLVLLRAPEGRRVRHVEGEGRPAGAV